MKLERLDIAGFGRLRDVAIEFGDGLTVVAGPNEAGKSTIVECIVRMLFGFPEAHHNKARQRYEPWVGGPFRATLRFRTDDGHSFETSRDFSRGEVPTDTVDAVTRRPVAALSGNKSTAPGTELLHISLDVYRAAAVVSAEDGAEWPGSASQPLAERLAEVIGSAGDASAAQAMEALGEARSGIGLHGANTPLGKAIRDADEADVALRRFREEHDAFADTIRAQAELNERAHDIAARRSRCAAALAAVRLRAIRSRITEASDAQRQLDVAIEHRRAIDAGPAAASERRDDVDAAAEAFRSALQGSADAEARVATRSAERASIQRDFDAAGNELLERRASVSRFEDAIAKHETAAAERPEISSDALAALEREADDADSAESRARNLETAAAIARQRSRPSAFAPAVSFIACAALIAVWLFVHGVAFAIGAGITLALGIASSVAFSAASRRRREAIASAEAAAAEAVEENDKASAELAVRCRALGCKDVGAVRAARTAQIELDRIRLARDSAREAARHIAQRREVLEKRLADVDSLEGESRAADQRADDRRKALDSLLDDVGIAPGSVDDRLAEYRRSRNADEFAARAEAAIGHARAALERARGGATVESLQEEADRHAAEAASGGDPGEFAGREANDLAAELEALTTEQRRLERELYAVNARVEEFERKHQTPAAELEERAAEATQRRDRLRAARAALETAGEEIERARDLVHQDFTPPLNEAAGRFAAAMTGGRYPEVWIDQADFKLRVRIPETKATQEEDVLSTGTRQQLDLALRAALATVLAGDTEKVPLLVDDAVANADDVRAEAALLQAAQLARGGEQVVFFTHRDALEARASALVGVAVVRLEGPGASAPFPASPSREEPAPTRAGAAPGEPSDTNGMLPGLKL